MYSINEYIIQQNIHIIIIYQRWPILWVCRCNILSIKKLVPEVKLRVYNITTSYFGQKFVGRSFSCWRTVRFEFAHYLAYVYTRGGDTLNNYLLHSGPRVVREHFIVCHGRKSMEKLQKTTNEK